MDLDAPTLRRHGDQMAVEQLDLSSRMMPASIIRWYSSTVIRRKVGSPPETETVTVIG